ncbi:MAG: START-like domain-containing protein [Bacteroidaceae bacterium]
MIKEKLKLEYLLQSTSKNVIWDAISSSSGLERWFADRVIISDRHATFSWGDEEVRETEIIAIRTFHFIRFHWSNDPDDRSYLEMRMNCNEMTGKYTLIITDFADSDDIEMQHELWDAQIEVLMRKTGL